MLLAPSYRGSSLLGPVITDSHLLIGDRWAWIIIAAWDDAKSLFLAAKICAPRSHPVLHYGDGGGRAWFQQNPIPSLLHAFMKRSSSKAQRVAVWVFLLESLVSKNNCRWFGKPCPVSCRKRGTQLSLDPPHCFSNKILGRHCKLTKHPMMKLLFFCLKRNHLLVERSSWGV